MTRKIGIFGGTFDPVHRGHIALLRAAQKHFRFDFIYVLPTAQNPLKAKSHISRAERLRRLRRAIRPLGFARISLLEWRGRGPRYTVDTLSALRRRHPGADLCFICGSDAQASFDRWKDPAKILRLATLAVAHRAGFPRPQKREGWVVFPMKPVRLSSTRIRANMINSRL